jgi:hypothetical protein
MCQPFSHLAYPAVLSLYRIISYCLPYHLVFLQTAKSGKLGPVRHGFPDTIHCLSVDLALTGVLVWKGSVLVVVKEKPEAEPKLVLEAGLGAANGGSFARVPPVIYAHHVATKLPTHTPP